MNGKTKIEWTDTVWNPVTGCTKVSAGCKNCYAEVIANRFWGSRKFTDVRIHKERLQQPLNLRYHNMIFVNSMSDLFHEDVVDEFIIDVFLIMAKAKHQIFQILTKRPERMRDFFEDCMSMPPILPLANVWLGVSVENQETAALRIPILLETRFAHRFISAEPLLDQINLKDIKEYRDRDMTGIDWLICGGESGPHARPMHPDWVRSLRGQCKAAGVPFFFKQWGGVNKKKAGHLLDGKEYREFPKF